MEGVKTAGFLRGGQGLQARAVPCRLLPDLQCQHLHSITHSHAHTPAHQSTQERKVILQTGHIHIDLGELAIHQEQGKGRWPKPQAK